MNKKDTSKSQIVMLFIFQTFLVPIIIGLLLYSLNYFYLSLDFPIRRIIIKDSLPIFIAFTFIDLIFGILLGFQKLTHKSNYLLYFSLLIIVTFFISMFSLVIQPFDIVALAGINLRYMFGFQENAGILGIISLFYLPTFFSFLITKILLRKRNLVTK